MTGKRKGPAGIAVLLLSVAAAAPLGAQRITEFPLPSGGGFDLAAGPLRTMWLTQPGANRVARVTSWGEITELPIPTPDADPRGIAATRGGGAWFTEYGSNKIGLVQPNLTIVEFPVPTPAAGPFGIAADADGNAWFTEADAGKIGRITPAGVVTEFLIPTAGSNPRGIVANSDGNVWFTETGANQIGRITPGGGVTEFPVPTASSHPFGIDADLNNGNLWFTETSGNALGRLTLAGVFTEYPIPTPGVSPSGIAVGAGGIWFTESEGHRIGIMSSPGIFVEVEIPTPNARPRGIAISTDFRPWFVEEDGGNVGLISRLSESADFPGPMAANAVGDVFLINSSDYVYRYEPGRDGWSAGYGTEIPTAGSNPEGIAAGNARDAWFTEYTANQIGHFTLDGEITEFPLPLPGRGPSGIAFGADGNAWFTEYFGNAIGRMTPAGVLTEFPLPTIGANPQSIVAGPDGNLWFTEYDASKVARITPSGVITEFLTPTTFAAPSAITAGPDGNLWFTEVAGNAIGRITPEGDVTEFPIPTAGASSAGITAGPDGNLWFTEYASNKIGRITTAGHIDEAAITQGPSSAADIVAAADGQIWIAKNGILTLIFRPAVIGIGPTAGPAAGGELLTAMGFDFVEGCALEVGGVAAPAPSVVDERRMTATMPALPPGAIQDVVVTRPDGSVFRSPRARVSDFTDVPAESPFHFYVESIFRAGITSGCGGGSYCVSSPITRAQMAVFLMRAHEGPTFIPRPCEGVFADVPCPSPFAEAVEYLAARGITGGCGAGVFCPGNPVSRAQMAVFLLKTRRGTIYEPPPCTGVFADVACPGGFAADWIEALAGAGITGGCGGANYCPGNPVTRGQMAIFLTRTFMP